MKKASFTKIVNDQTAFGGIPKKWHFFTKEDAYTASILTLFLKSYVFFKKHGLWESLRALIVLLAEHAVIFRIVLEPETTPDFRDGEHCNDPFLNIGMKRPDTLRFWVRFASPNSFGNSIQITPTCEEILFFG